MTPFEAAYDRALKGAPLSPAARIMAELIGAWFKGRDDRLEIERKARLAMEERVKALEKTVFDLKNRGDAA